MAPDAANQGSAPQEPQPGADAQPKRLGGFELLGRLGKGGMGTVLKARQVSMDRLVALKILPKKLAENETFVQRFLREARSAAKLRHPNIVQAFDVGFVDGYYFFAMEFVDGETLSEIVRHDGPLEPDRALGVMKQVASALAAAHDGGIVHRDIKPSNIMIDKEGQVRVTDFGLAKRTEGDVEVTADGSVLGTPAYVAPEMAKGGHADARSDLYSLGATFFCALAGRPPFEGKNFSEVLIKQVNETPPPLATLAPRVDRRLCHIIDRLLRKNPEARSPSAKALLDDLNGLGKLQSVAATARAEGRALIAEAPTLDMSDGQRRAREVRGPRPTASGRRPTTLIAVGAIVAILALVGIVVATRKPKDRAAAPQSSPQSSPHAPREGSVPRSVTTTEKRKAEDAEKGRVAKAKEETLAKARQQGEDLLREADAAIAAKDFPKARAALKPIEALDLPELAQQAKSKLAEIDSREKSAAEWAKWDALKADAKKLIDAGKLDDAAKLLDGAKALPLDGIIALIAEQMQTIAAARKKAADAALAAYQAESDKVWALFKERKYPEADKLLADLVARGVGAGLVPAQVGTPTRGAPTADYLAADQEAAKLLKEFWTAVERGVMARKGKFVSIGGRGGNVESVADGQVTLKVGAKEFLQPLLGMDAAQASALADIKDDERGNLTRAIFLLAEGEKLDDAEKLLAAAGKAPGLAFYKDRLDALTLGTTELAARKAWAEIETLAKGKLTKAQTATLGKLLDEFEKEHGQSKSGKEVAEQIAALRARIGKAAAPVVYTEWPFDAAEAKRRQAETAKALGVPIEQDIDLGGGLKMTFVLIPAGEFLMGSPPTTNPDKLAAAYTFNPRLFESEFPQHCVRISRPFWIGKYEVTQEEWMAVSPPNPSTNKDNTKNPVQNVRWGQAHEFATVLSEKLAKTFRLPSEAEWEYACRAGAATEFYFGNEAARLSDFGWAFGTGSAQPVGQKKPNAWGICDMAGNVWEWCEDWYGRYESGAQTDPKGQPAGRLHVIRGGSWRMPPSALRSAFRLGAEPTDRHEGLGFRVVLAPEPERRAETVKAGGWQSLFDGKTLDGWKVVSSFPGQPASGKVAVEGGQIVLRRGTWATGIVWDREFPKNEYEVSMEISQIEGEQIGVIVFPIGDSRCGLNLNPSSGLDTLDGKRHSENETTSRMEMRTGHWYGVRLRVARERVQTWVDEKKTIDLSTVGRTFDVYPCWSPIKPFGLCTWGATSAVRNIRLRRIEP